MREEPVFLKTCVWRCREPENVMLSSELLYQYFDRDEACIEGENYRVEVAVCLFWFILKAFSHSNNLTISWHLLVCDNFCASARSNPWDHGWSVVFAAFSARRTGEPDEDPVQLSQGRVQSPQGTPSTAEYRNVCLYSAVYLNAVELYLQPELATSTVLSRRLLVVLSNLSVFVLFKNVFFSRVTS